MEWTSLHDNLIDPLFIYSPEKGILKFNLSFLLYFDFSPREVRKIKNLNELILNPSRNVLEDIKPGTYQELVFLTSKNKKLSVIYLIELLDDNSYLFHFKDAALEINLQEKYSQQILELERINKDQEIIIQERTKDLQESYQLMRRVLTSLKGEVYVLDDLQMIKASFGSRSNTHNNLKFSECFDFVDSQKRNFIEWYDSYLNIEDQREILLELAPDKFHIGDKIYRPDFYHIPNQDKFELAVILNDITEEETLKVKSVMSDELSSAIHKALLNKNNFHVFFKSFEKLKKKYLNSNETKNLLSFKRDLHTLKGLFSQYGLTFSSSQIHELEEEVGILPEESEEKFFKIIRSADEVLEKLLSLIGESLNISHDEFLKLASILSFFEETLNDTLKNTLKEKANLELNGDLDYHLNPFQIDQLTIAFLHYARNIAVHAAETSEQRLQKNKTPAINVTIQVQKIGDSINLKIIDDGKGTDKQSEIFEQKISSTSTNSDLYSGRGLGMTAIKDAVEKISGMVNFSSQVEVGSNLEISIKTI